ncbi:MAG: isoamylase [Monoraphidium minutum]|nr:MAG: isoamylase [Monoraphidium minutum]
MSSTLRAGTQAGASPLIAGRRPIQALRASNRSSKAPRTTICSAAVQLAPVTATAPRRTPLSSPSLLPVPGGAKGAAYGAPLRGSPETLGATYDKELGAYNFAVFSSAARRVSLVLFTEQDLAAGRATYEIPLDADANRTGDVWHIMLPGLDPSLLYGYRIEGPHQDKSRAADGGHDNAAAGHRCDEVEVVVDPYAKALLSRRRYGALGPKELDYTDPGVLGLAETWPQMAAWLPQPGGDGFDWQGDRPLGLPMADLVIYEMHVRGFTEHPSSGVEAPGTYLGLVEKLDYIKRLGINAIELLPVFEFNELEYYSPIPGQEGAYRYNFWGYSTVNYFSPMARYSFAAANGADGEALRREFKTLVREAHRRGIEVILDVVFNHSAEGNEAGPTISMRGLDNRVYYMLAPGGEYYNYSGCGNTLNCNHPVVRDFIVDCLRYWVEEYHVDGFRFDLASIMTRAHSAWHPQKQTLSGAVVGLHSPPEGAPMGPILDDAGVMTDGGGASTGAPLSNPPLIEAISEDPILRNVKLIAEAWDCDGLNQVGAFPHYGGRWSEWNGTFRDTVRQFMKGTDGPWAGNFASALCGSPGLYASTTAGEDNWWANNGGAQWKGNRSPDASINFVCAHDGFTLADLVAYNEKHNEANGEGNNDGESHNLSWNCGEEGATTDVGVNRLRQRQMRNMAAALLLSHGVPMIQMGDEYGHSKGGNNNTYCHDDHLNWVDWQQAAADETGFARFVRRMIHFRRQRPELRRRAFVGDGEITWHGELPNEPDWSEASRLVAYTLADGQGGGLYVAFNTSHRPKVLELPKWHGRSWQPVFDTSKVAPYDALIADEELGEAEVTEARLSAAMWGGGGFFPLLPWSCVVLDSVPDASLTALRSRPAGAAAPPRGGPPTAEDERAAKAAKRNPTPEQLFDEVTRAQR